MVVAFVALPASLEPLAAAVQFIGLDRPTDWAGIAGARKYDCIHAFTHRRAEIEDSSRATCKTRSSLMG